MMDFGSQTKQLWTKCIENSTGVRSCHVLTFQTNLIHAAKQQASLCWLAKYGRQPAARAGFLLTIGKRRVSPSGTPKKENAYVAEMAG